MFPLSLLHVKNGGGPELLDLSKGSPALGSGQSRTIFAIGFISRRTVMFVVAKIMNYFASSAPPYDQQQKWCGIDFPV